MKVLSKKEMVAAFRSLNYSVYQSFYNHLLWKTNAPSEAVYDILKQYKKEKYAQNYLKNCPEDSLAHTILSKPLESKKKMNFHLKNLMPSQDKRCPL